MTTIRPFRALRYDPARVDLSRVLAPPYDVVAAEDRDLTVFVREMDRNEYEQDTMADAVWSYNGAEPEDPMQAFSTFADELGLKRARVGMEVP